MREFKVHIPDNESELRLLEGKVVKFFEGSVRDLSEDKLLFKLNLDNAEFISQGKTSSSPAYPDSCIYSEIIRLINLKFNFQGCGYQLNRYFATYQASEIEYDSRKKALENVGLWENTDKRIH